MLPNFFVVGAQKAGTTSLFHLLSGHPDVFLPEQKETKFFARDREWLKGLSYYENQHFSGMDGQSAIGEIDPDYMYCDWVLERIEKAYEGLEGLKFIFVLRNPVERAFSHYLMSYRRGLEDLSFSEAVKAEEGRLVTGDFDQRMHYSYVDRGFYSKQIEPYMRKLKSNQLLFLKSTDLNRNPEAVVKEVCQFLGVSDSFVPSNLGERFHSASRPRMPGMRRFVEQSYWIKRVIRLLVPHESFRHRLRKGLLTWNESGKYDEKPVLSDDARNELLAVYEEEISLLESRLNLDLSDWR